MDSENLDNQFDDAAFEASLRNTRLARPRAWPRSVSEMRASTSYASQGMTSDHDTGHSRFMLRRPYVARVPAPAPAAAPRSGLAAPWWVAQAPGWVPPPPPPPNLLRRWWFQP